VSSRRCQNLDFVGCIRRFVWLRFRDPDVLPHVLALFVVRRVERRSIHLVAIANVHQRSLLD
jgi:hypothetical protein